MPLSYVYRGGAVRLMFLLVDLALVFFMFVCGAFPFGNKFLIIQKKKNTHGSLKIVHIVRSLDIVG